jgi:hypothetical protein
VRVRRDEGLAIRIDPKPCAVVHEDGGDASAGERAGQPLSRESDISQGADAVTYAEGDSGPHAPDSEPGKCVSGSGACTRASL